MTATARRVEPAPETPAAMPAPAPVPAPQPAAQAAPAAPRKGRRRALMLALPLALALGGGYVWLTGGRYVTTDNAYVRQPLVAVSADLAGRIAEVDVAENQEVAAGAPLFRLDPEPFQIALDQADANLAAARLSVEQLRAAHATAEAKLTAAEDILAISRREFERQTSLTDRGVATTAALDQATEAVRGAEANVALAKQGVVSAVAALGGDPAIATEEVPAVRAAEAQRRAAARNLDRATVTAPVAGRVSQVGSLNPGQFVSPGAAVASLVQTGNTWIEANYKETQLAGLHPGQPVEVEIDAYPGLTLPGTVDSLSSATGAQFALIPAQNATGNWVKVVQRLAVRIRVEADPDHPLRDGMSAHVATDTGASRLDRLMR